MIENENKYLSLKTAAGLYGYTRDHLGLMIRQGKLQGLKLGSYYVTTNDWMIDYLKKYADLDHSHVKGKFSNKFLTQVFNAKENKKNKENKISSGGISEEKNKALQKNISNKLEDDFFGNINKELLPSLRELSAAQVKTSISSVSSAVSYINSGNPYVILPIRQMEESERENILKKISDCDRSKNEQEAV
ncbi:MAG: hypothetical protein HYV51_01140 [Parcubacteria group bacterium]|nr:hypothetical protein [Parcubacteria group bacterium]